MSFFNKIKCFYYALRYFLLFLRWKRCYQANSNSKDYSKIKEEQNYVLKLETKMGNIKKNLEDIIGASNVTY